jgi:hypothetical protein
MQNAGPLHASGLFVFGVWGVISNAVLGIPLILPGAGIAWIGLVPAIKRLSGSPYRVLPWEWATLLLPGEIWLVLLATTYQVGRKTMGNFVEPSIFGCVMAVLAVAVRWGGARGIPPRLLRAGFVVLNCTAAVLTFFLTPALAE